MTQTHITTEGVATTIRFIESSWVFVPKKPTARKVFAVATKAAVVGEFEPVAKARTSAKA